MRVLVVFERIVVMVVLVIFYLGKGLILKIRRGLSRMFMVIVSMFIFMGVFVLLEVFIRVENVMNVKEKGILVKMMVV